VSEDKTNNSIPTKTVLPVIEDNPLPDLKQWKKPMTPIRENNSLSTVSSREEPPPKTKKIIQKPIEDEFSISTISSAEEKEIKVSGKELNLFDSNNEEGVKEIDLNDNDLFDLNSLISLEQGAVHTKKIESLDSASLNKFVTNIKHEFNNKEEASINIDIDELSFLNQKEKDNLSSIIPKKVESENFSFLKPKKLEPENVSFIQPKEGVNQIVPYIKQSEPEMSIDLEKIEKVLKEDGTIIDLSQNQSNTFPLQNITPILKENDKSIDQSSNRSSKQINLNNNIKKISIKYNAKIPFKPTQKKKTQKGKTTLVEEAADDDSSEMIFK
jgi:hypothetical protein